MVVLRVWLVLAVVASGACEAEQVPASEPDIVVVPPEGTCVGSCESDDDCGPAYLCVDERVIPEGRTCRSPEVVPFEENRWVPGVCRFDAHCGAREHCSVGRVVRICMPRCPDVPCPAERPVCIDGICGTCDPGARPPCIEASYECLLPLQKDFGQCEPICRSDEDCPGGFCGL